MNKNTNKMPIRNKIKVLLIPTHAHEGSGGGVRIYNESIVSLFRSDETYEVEILNILPHHTIFGIKYNKKELEKAILEINPDVIHVNGYTTLLPRQIVKIGKKYHIKLIYTAHWHPFKTMTLSWIKQIYFYLFVAPNIRHFDSVIAINLEEHKFLKKFSSHVSLVHHWLRTMPNGLNQDKKKNMILFVGNLTYANKGFDYLNLLPQEQYDIHCVGRGCPDSLRDDMTLHTNISEIELDQLYRQASLLVIPSRYEAFSYVALESLSRGTPVLMSENVRIADYLKGVQGYSIFHLGDEQEWIDKVKESIGSYVDVKSIKRIFDSKIALTKYKAIYNKKC